MKKWVHAKTNKAIAIDYVLIGYPDRSPIKNPDTGEIYSFESKKAAEQFIEDNPYLRFKHRGLSVDGRALYNDSED